MKLVAALTALAVAACAWGSNSGAPVYGYEVVRRFPHDPGAFTQGLFIRDGVLYESTGLEGRSSIRKVDLETGQVLMRRDVPPQFFGEGSVDWRDRIISLTWRSEVGLIHDLHTLEPVGRFRYPGEGWGLTRDDKRLIMSDGSSVLRFLDPETLQETGRVRVTDGGRPIDNLNELEWVKGEIFANIWQTDRIARIDPGNGKVVGWIDLAGLLDSQTRRQSDVLNGIAYDASTDRLFVTGKLWPSLYQIRLKPKSGTTSR